MAIRIYLDNNVYDEIFTRAGVKDLVFRSRTEGVAKFYSCHLTRDELNDMGPEKAKLHTELLRIAEELPEKVPSTPGVFDFGRFDETAFGDETANSIYETLQAKHGSEDAIHVATAISVGCDYFVTQETTDGLLKDVNRLGLKMKAIDVNQMTELLGASCTRADNLRGGS